MSILENSSIDGMGIDEDGQTLVFMISDHLDWENEGEHLLLLQDKLNAYLGYIEAKEFQEVYPQHEFLFFFVEIYFEYFPTNNYMKFYKIMNK